MCVGTFVVRAYMHSHKLCTNFLIYCRYAPFPPPQHHQSVFSAVKQFQCVLSAKDFGFSSQYWNPVKVLP